MTKLKDLAIDKQEKLPPRGVISVRGDVYCKIDKIAQERECSPFLVVKALVEFYEAHTGEIL